MRRRDAGYGDDEMTVMSVRRFHVTPLVILSELFRCYKLEARSSIPTFQPGGKNTFRGIRFGPALRAAPFARRFFVLPGKTVLGLSFRPKVQWIGGL